MAAPRSRGNRLLDTIRDGASSRYLDQSRRQLGVRIKDALAELDTDVRVVLLGALAGVVMIALDATGHRDLVKFAAVPAFGLALLTPVAGVATFAAIVVFPEIQLTRVISYELTLVIATLVSSLARIALSGSRIGIRPVVVALLAYVGISAYQLLYVAGTQQTSHASGAVYEFIQISTGLLLVLAAGYVAARTNPGPVLGVLVASAAAASALGLVSTVPSFVHRLGLTRLIPSVDLYGRASGPFMNPNYFGLYAALAFALVVAWPPGGTRLMARLRLLAAIVIGAGVVLSLSRAALIAAAIGVVVVAFMRYGRRAGVAGLIGAVGLAFIAYPTMMEIRLAVTFGPDLAGGLAAKAASDSWRLDTLVAGLRMFRSSPVLGIGLGQFHFVSPSFLHGSPLTYAHDWYVNVLAEQGVVGAGTYMLFIMLAGFALFRSASRFRTAGLALMAAFLAGSLVTEPVSSLQTAGIFWIVLGVAIGSIPEAAVSLPPEAATVAERRGDREHVQDLA